MPEVTPKPVIVPVEIETMWKEGKLNSRLALKDISKRLGMEPNSDGDGVKVKFQWMFTADGVPCSVWDFDGERWSTFGPAEKLKAIFGDDYTG